MKRHEFRPRLKEEDIELILEALDVYIAQRLEGLDETEVDKLAREGKLPKVRRAVELIDKFESLKLDS